MKTLEEKKSSGEWLEDEEFEGLCILDPDGWDRKNFDKSWNEKITKRNFIARIMKSTIKEGQMA